MWNYGIDILIWLIVWSVVGSTLGFFSIRNSPVWTGNQRLMEYIKSVSIGLFFALPTYSIFREYQVFPNVDFHGLSIMIAGGVSFAITDLIIKVWPRFVNGFGRAISKLLDHLINKI